jgi:hypothetical protein
MYLGVVRGEAILLSSLENPAGQSYIKLGQVGS